MSKLSRRHRRANTSRMDRQFWGKTYGHHQLKKKVCEAQGHTWSYDEPFRHSGRLQGMIRRTCSCCNRDEVGQWDSYSKKKGWVFLTIEVWHR